MTIVEKMARAIYDADNDLDGDCVGDMIYGDFRIDGPAANAREQTMRVCRAAALAALKAIREPDEGMVRAMHNEGGQSMLAIFTAAIDHAIQEHEG